MAAKWNIEPTKPHLATNQQHRVNVPAATPKEYWRRALYLPLVDHLLEELNERLLKQHDTKIHKDPPAHPRYDRQVFQHI